MLIKSSKLIYSSVEVFKIRFNLFNQYMTSHIICFLSQFGKLYFLRNFLFCLNIKIVNFFIIPLIFLKKPLISVVMPSFSLLILFISLFTLSVSPTISNYICFSKKQLWFYWLFLDCFLFNSKSILFCSLFLLHLILFFFALLTKKHS